MKSPWRAAAVGTLNKALEIMSLARDRSPEKKKNALLRRFTTFGIQIGPPMLTASSFWLCTVCAEGSGAT